MKYEVAEISLNIRLKEYYTEDELAMLVDIGHSLEKGNALFEPNHGLALSVYGLAAGCGDIVYDIVNVSPAGVSVIEEWSEEWKEKKLISELHVHNRYIAFSTHFLDELFITNRDEMWPCYYWIWPIPLPKQISLEFFKQYMDKKALANLDRIKNQLNQKPLKNEWRRHILRTWGTSGYSPNGSEDFSEVSTELKAELERIISKEIPAFESELLDILSN